MADNRLGRGLRALIPDIPLDEEKSRVDTINEIRVALISPNPFQPREDFDPVALEELKKSIAEKGIIQPITVRPWESGYQLIAGERRLRAVVSLGHEFIPAYVMNVQTDEELIELALIENIQREDLNPVDIAKGYQQLLTQCQLTQEQVAQKVGKERSTVTNFLRLLKLPTKILDSLKKGEVDMGHARALLSIDDTAIQLEAWQQIVKKKLSVRNVESLVKQLKNKSDKQDIAVEHEKSIYIVDLEEKLQQKLGTKVRIQAGKKGGKIEIEYYSDEELERLIELLNDVS
jgi:ParB family transcriptional regulator, chromosome partitioning protein